MLILIIFTFYTFNLAKEISIFYERTFSIRYVSMQVGRSRWAVLLTLFPKALNKVFLLVGLTTLGIFIEF